MKEPEPLEQDEISVMGHKVKILGAHKFKNKNHVLVLEPDKLTMMLGADIEKIVIMPSETSAKRVLIGVVLRDIVKEAPQVIKPKTSIVGLDGKALT